MKGCRLARRGRSNSGTCSVPCMHAACGVARRPVPRYSPRAGRKVGPWKLGHFSRSCVRNRLPNANAEVPYAPCMSAAQGAGCGARAAKVPRTPPFQACLQRLRMVPVCWVDCLKVTGDASSSCEAASFQQARLGPVHRCVGGLLLFSLARCSGSQTRRARAVLLRCGCSLNSGDRGPSKCNGCTNPALGPHLQAPTKSAAAQVVPQQSMALTAATLPA